MIKPYYEEPNITIYNGDCLEVMKELSDNFVNYCLTSPPYNLRNPVRQIGKYYNYEDKLTDNKYFELLKEFYQSAKRVVLNYVFLNIMYVSTNKLALLNFLGKYSENVKDILIWEKPFQPAIQYNVLTHNYEFIFVLSKNFEDRAYKKDFGKRGKYKTLFFSKHNAANRLSFNTLSHSAIMPIQIASYLIETFTDPGDIILDPFLGLGTTARACKDLGRKCIGIEISKEYCDIAVKRLGQEVLNLMGV